MMECMELNMVAFRSRESSASFAERKATMT